MDSRLVSLQKKNGKHEFTTEEASAGGKARAKDRLKLARLEAKTAKAIADREILLAVLSHPVAVPTLIYLGSGFLRTKSAPAVASDSATKQFLDQWKHNFGQFLNTVGIPASAFSGGTADQLGIDALQAALLINIASGGNLAGIFTQAGGVIGKALAGLAIK